MTQELNLYIIGGREYTARSYAQALYAHNLYLRKQKCLQ